ncbi:MAG: ATP-binding protein [bacterium]
MAAKQTPVEAHDALDNLVNQFSDPMSFFRELIQNALDAGSPEIDISFEYRAGEGTQDGIMIVHVDDFGEGMDREIIDTRLTRLFSSSKDGDLTKIGRFGIGFVSVFAIQPDAVCLDTSRGGENWRVLFQRDRSFVRIQRDEPTDGTDIQIIKTMSADGYAEFVRRATEVVTYWCKHAKAEIRVDDEPINLPFDLECPVKVQSSADGTDVVVGFPADAQPFFGFYNKGLTLHEGREDLLGGLAFKISSRYLEHTLTRDNVLRDDNFHKAMEIARELAEGPLIRQLFDQLAEAVADGRPGRGRGVNFLYDTAAHVIASGRVRTRDLDDRVLWRTVSGREATVGAIRKRFRKGRLWIDTKMSPLIAALEEDDHVVLHGVPDTPAHNALVTLLGEAPPAANQAFCKPVLPRSEDEVSTWAPLRRSLSRLFEAYGAKLSDVAVAHFAYPGSSIYKQVAITQREPGELTNREDAKALGASLFSRRRVLVVNADHATVQRLIAVAGSEPELASYTLAKLFFLRGELSTGLDSELLGHALGQRRLRCAGKRRTGGDTDRREG